MRKSILAVALLFSAATTFSFTPAVASGSQQQATTQPVTPTDSFFEFYAKNLRQSLFSGFLTLGSFLVAVNTFIVVNLKKELYDHPTYRKKVKANREQERRNREQATAKPNVQTTESSFYGPLKHLSGLLLVTIAVSLFTAVSQLTIGVFITNAVGAGICLASAAVTIFMLGYVLWIIRLNLRDWFGHWEEQACEEEQNELNGKTKSG